MIHSAGDEQRRAFSHWLRTGRLPQVRSDDGVELKFNPWHDPDDGRFTFAGSGNHFGAGEGGAPQSGRPARRARKIAFKDDPAESQIKTQADANAWRAKNLARYGADPDNRRKIDAKYWQYLAALKPVSNDPPKPATAAAAGANGGSSRAAEFMTGVGEGGYAVAKGTAKAIYSAVTTNPATTIGEIGNGISDKIDRAIAAEDTPARVHLSEAAKSIANASARDIGRAVGSTAANAALAAVPGVAAAKVTWLRRARLASHGKSFDAPTISWRKETISSKNERVVAYNDSAPGAQPGLAPALERTMPDGSRRYVKFDGVEGEYMIDRKWSVGRWKKSQDQLLRQSEVLAQHDLFATMEVPNRTEMKAALKLLKKLNIKNIKVRVVKP